MVGQYTSRDAVQPWQRVGRDIVEPSPGDQKRLGHRVLGEITGGATERISADGAVVLTKQLLEPGLARSFHDLAHAGYMSGNRRGITGQADCTRRGGTELRRNRTFQPSGYDGDYAVSSAAK